VAVRVNQGNDLCFFTYYACREIISFYHILTFGMLYYGVNVAPLIFL